MLKFLIISMLLR